ncbi:MAG: hypothetical protein CK424_02330 [Legionella sp.]|nr:MAG: hypothetical protein CK424_02330 [Legionella sp.]
MITMSARNLDPDVMGDAGFWSQINAMQAHKRLSQSMLWVAPQDVPMTPILDRFLADSLCLAAHPACGVCPTCIKILQDGHPDVHYIRPDTVGGAIKIEQIREIQLGAYQTPQLGQYQFMILHPADALNNAAASALLKILEEPSLSTIFILITSHPGLLLPTIGSRCQRLYIQHEVALEDRLALGCLYAETTVRGTLFSKRTQLLSDLDALLLNTATPCDIAARWSEYPLADVLWFLYALLAKLIDRRLLPTTPLETEYQEHALFARQWQPERLFTQLDTMQDFMRKLQHNVNLNSTLALERVLLEFLEGSS